VSLRAAGPTLSVIVRDWGRGIEPGDLPHIFEPFRQGPRSDNSHRGLGLGLAITHNIVELFGGELSASSEGVGHGATFTLRLPMAQAQEPIETEVGLGLHEEEQRRLAGLRVLYVEDEADIAEGVRFMLSELGAQVDLCPSFGAASARIVAGGFDILLSDLNLGGGHTALELIGLLRATPNGDTIPAIVLSAYGSTEDRNASLRAGFAKHLVKPVVAAEVARALIDAMSGGRHR
jgi:CheY-like chemotaxis protein